ncbi:MAG: cytidylate kinase [Crocinitomicaceae bacterium]|nr:cytidylate kinase [Crocinitomicaceae bacterium]|tara:strand:+ start:316 stop:1008 length:693 start_codon:yes stop_codon:yes gene_type:complete
MQKINIAIDGFSSCGKSTIAKALAKTFNYIFVDTGAMYRAVTLFAIRNECFDEKVLDAQKLIQLLDQIEIGFEYNSQHGKSDTILNGENVEQEIRGMEVSSRVSPVATVKEVREKLVAQQQKIGEKGGVVMDGRDIGTVVFPKAELKLFITASLKVRVERRYQELLQKGKHVTYEEVENNLSERDKIDTEREVDPLKQAEDAVLIDNSNLTQEEQMTMIEALARLRMLNA